VNWKVVNFSALEGVLSTGEAQPLPRDEWPAWAQGDPRFTGAWYSFVGGPTATSSGDLSTGHIQASVEIERTAPTGKPLRYYHLCEDARRAGVALAPSKGSQVRASPGRAAALVRLYKV
jgi:hypothetical protein